MENFDETVQQLKTKETQNKDMTKENEETVEIRAEIPKQEFEEMKEFIDEHKESRKYSNAFYTRKMFEIALEDKRQFEEHFGHVLDVLKD